MGFRANTFFIVRSQDRTVSDEFENCYHRIVKKIVLAVKKIAHKGKLLDRKKSLKNNFRPSFEERPECFLKSALFHLFKVCFRNRSLFRERHYSDGFAELLFTRHSFNFISQSTTQGSFTTKENPCSSEMAETRGDIMFLSIFLARTVRANTSILAKISGGQNSSTF